MKETKSATSITTKISNRNPTNCGSCGENAVLHGRCPERVSIRVPLTWHRPPFRLSSSQRLNHLIQIPSHLNAQLSMTSPGHNRDVCELDWHTIRKTCVEDASTEKCKLTSAPAPPQRCPAQPRCLKWPQPSRGGLRGGDKRSFIGGPGPHGADCAVETNGHSLRC